MKCTAFAQAAAAQLADLSAHGLLNTERALNSPQGAQIGVAGCPALLNLCSNNYLRVANHPAVIETARRALAQYGYGMASVRFIGGTHDVHRQLEERLSTAHGAFWVCSGTHSP